MTVGNDDQSSSITCSVKQKPKSTEAFRTIKRWLQPNNFLGHHRFLGRSFISFRSSHSFIRSLSLLKPTFVHCAWLNRNLTGGMATLLFLVVLLVTACRAANDWSQPCFNGRCSYDVPESTKSSGSMIIVSF